MKTLRSENKEYHYGQSHTFHRFIHRFYWVVSKLINALPDLFLVFYQFSDTFLLMLGWVFWLTTDYSSGKGGGLLLQIFIMMPFYFLFLAKMANQRANNKGGAQVKSFRGCKLSMSTFFFPIGMRARKMASLDKKGNASEKPVFKDSD